MMRKGPQMAHDNPVRDPQYRLPAAGPSRSTASPPAALFIHDQEDATPAPTTIERPRVLKKRSSNNARSRTANPQILTTMISSLDDITPPTSEEKSRYFEVRDGYHSRPTRPRAPSDTLSFLDDKASPPPELRRPPVGNDGDVGGVRTTWHENDSAESPVVPRSKRMSMQMQPDKSQATPESGFRRLFRTASMRSRSSVTVHSVDSDGASMRSSASTQPAGLITPRSTSVNKTLQVPSPEPRTRWRKNTEQVLNGQSSKPTKASADGERKDSHVEAEPRDVLQQPTSPRVARKPVGRAPPHSLKVDTSPAPHLVSSQSEARLPAMSSSRIGKAKSPTAHKRLSPLPSPVDAVIPLRGSSLAQAEKRTTDSDRKVRRKLRGLGNRKTSASRLKKAALSGDVLEELGDSDEVVRRIRELKQQREERQRLQEAQQVAAEEEEEQNNDLDVTASLVDNADFIKPESFAARNSPELRVNGETAVPTVSEVNAPRPQQTTRLADNAKAHAMLGLKASAMQDTQGYFPPSHVAPRDQLQPSIDGVSRPSLSATLQRTSTDSVHSLSLTRPEYDYARAVRSLEKESRASSDDKISQDSAHPRSSEMLAARRQNGTSPTNVDAKRQTLVLDTAVNGVTPKRRDSIEGDVTAFLDAPRMNQTTRHPKTGRVISFSEVGDQSGHAVFVCVGMGLTRYVSAFYDDLAATLGLRLITPERPGVGKSEAYTDRDSSVPMSWHQDVHAICLALAIDKFSLLAHSAGAIFALATALVLPHQVTGRVYLLAPWIPPSQFEAAPSSTNPSNLVNRDKTDILPVGSLPRSQRLLRVLPVSLLKAANSSFLGLNTNSMTSATSSVPVAPSTNLRAPSPQPRNRLRRKSIAGPAALDPSAADFEEDAAPPLSLLGPSSPAPMPPGSTPLATVPQSPTSPAIQLSATAGPTDMDLTFAATHLSAAQHAKIKRDERYATALLHRIWAASTKDSNPASDLLVCLERSGTVGFRYADVRKGMVVLHGTEDRRVELRNVRWLVGRCNAAREGRRRERDRMRAEKVRRREERKARVSGEERVHGGKAGRVLGEELSPVVKGKADREREVRNGLAGLGLGISDEDVGRIKEVDVDDEDEEEGECELRVLQGEGHGLMAVASVMGEVLSEIAMENRARIARRTSLV